MNTAILKQTKTRALTIIEVLCVLFTFCMIILVLGLWLPSISRAKGANGPRIRCVNQLKNVGLACRIFSTDNGDKFPWELRTNQPPIKTFEEFLPYLSAFGSNEILNPSIFKCPADKQRTVSTNWANLSRANISYFFNIDSTETYPQSFLAGDRNIMTNGVPIGSGILKLSSTTTNVGWDSTIHQNQGNAVMGDGSVQQLSGARLRDQLRNTETESSTLVIP